MIKKFKFDYDPENDSLFMYNDQTKSKGSITLGDFIVDFTSKKKLSAIEILNAKNFFSDFVEDKKSISNTLSKIKSCSLDIIKKKGSLVIKICLEVPGQKELMAPLVMPTIHEPSPAVALSA